MFDKIDKFQYDNKANVSMVQKFSSENLSLIQLILKLNIMYLRFRGIVMR